MAKQKPVKPIQDYIQVLRGVASIQIKAIPGGWEVHVAPENPPVKPATAQGTPLLETVKASVDRFLAANCTTWQSLARLDHIADWGWGYMGRFYRACREIKQWH